MNMIDTIESKFEQFQVNSHDNKLYDLNKKICVVIGLQKSGNSIVSASIAGQNIIAKKHQQYQKQFVYDNNTKNASFMISREINSRGIMCNMKNTKLQNNQHLIIDTITQKDGEQVETIITKTYMIKKILLSCKQCKFVLVFPQTAIAQPGKDFLFLIQAFFGHFKDIQKMQKLKNSITFVITKTLKDQKYVYGQLEAISKNAFQLKQNYKYKIIQNILLNKRVYLYKQPTSVSSNVDNTLLKKIVNRMTEVDVTQNLNINIDSMLGATKYNEYQSKKYENISNELKTYGDKKIQQGLKILRQQLQNLVFSQKIDNKQDIKNFENQYLSIYPQKTTLERQNYRRDKLNYQPITKLADVQKVWTIKKQIRDKKSQISRSGSKIHISEKIYSIIRKYCQQAATSSLQFSIFSLKSMAQVVYLIVQNSRQSEKLEKLRLFKFGYLFLIQLQTLLAVEDILYGRLQTHINSLGIILHSNLTSFQTKMLQRLNNFSKKYGIQDQLNLEMMVKLHMCLNIHVNSYESKKQCQNILKTLNTFLMNLNQKNSSYNILYQKKNVVLLKILENCYEKMEKPQCNKRGIKCMYQIISMQLQQRYNSDNKHDSILQGRRKCANYIEKAVKLYNKKNNHHNPQKNERQIYCIWTELDIIQMYKSIYDQHNYLRIMQSALQLNPILHQLCLLAEQLHNVCLHEQALKVLNKAYQLKDNKISDKEEIRNRKVSILNNKQQKQKQYSDILMRRVQKKDWYCNDSLTYLEIIKKQMYEDELESKCTTEDFNDL